MGAIDIVESSAEMLVLQVKTDGTVLDAADVRRVTDELNRSLNQHPASVVVVDLSGIVCLSSSVLSELVRSSLEMKRSGRAMRLCCLTPELLTELRIMRLDTILNLFETQDDAR